MATVERTHSCHGSDCGHCYMNRFSDPMRQLKIEALAGYILTGAPADLEQAEAFGSDPMHHSADVAHALALVQNMRGREEQQV